MFSVIICEDDPQQQIRIEKIIKDTILIEDLDMKISLISDNPNSVLEFLKRNRDLNVLFFLDVDLNHEINGIELASKIREIDDQSKIVFVTTHDELSYLTFKYKVEALDYIIKDDIEGFDGRIKECMITAVNRYLQDNNSKKKKLKVKIGDKVRSFYYDDIMFFESSTTPHKIILHLDNSQFEYYASIKEISDLDDSFFRCHRSYVVNKDNIESVDVATREITMKNGEVCYSSIRALTGLIK